MENRKKPIGIFSKKPTYKQEHPTFVNDMRDNVKKGMFFDFEPSL
jgi:hypothetical protein